MGRDVGVFSNAAELVDRAEGADLGVIFDGDVAGESGAVDENGVIADEAIVGDVRVGHDQVMAADAGDGAAFDRAAIDRTEFAEFIFVADFEGNALAPVSEVLRVAADDGERIHMIFLAEARRPLNYRVMIEAAAVAEFDLVANHCVGADGYVRAEFRGRRDDSARVNVIHNEMDSYRIAYRAGLMERSGVPSGFKSTMAHMMVASTATSPFTRAKPCTLQNGPRKVMTFTSMRN